MTKHSESAEDTRYNDIFPQGQAKYFQPTPLGMGTRMVVFHHKTQSNVLRIPLRTEEELIILSGASHQHAGDAEADRVSNRTVEEIEHHEQMQEYLNGHLTGVVPFSVHDGQGKLRTYSHQRYIAPSQFQSHMHLFSRYVEVMDKKTRRSFLSFIESVRTMILELRLIPDLVGANNVIVSKRNHVQLVDVNNVRPVHTFAEWSQGQDEKELQSLWGEMVSCRQKVRTLFHPEFLDEHDYPVGDASVMRLLHWEYSLGTIQEKTAADDPVYGPMALHGIRERFVRMMLDDNLF